jgi:hypothetical protein
MTSFPAVAAQLPEAVKPLIDGYGFSMHVIDDFRFELLSPDCRLRYTAERYGPSVWVSIQDPKSSTQSEYDLVTVIALRDPSYYTTLRRTHAPVPDSAQLLIKVEKLTDILLRFCPDMLEGDFRKVNAEGYRDLEDYVRSNTPRVVNLPKGHPIKEKFWKGDLSWITDLKSLDSSGVLEKVSGTDHQNL